MGVIRNPEKISYMLDTKFINFREFEIWGGVGGGGGAPTGEGEGRCTALPVFFAIVSLKLQF